MTQWSPVSLRQQGAAWPGLNTRGGRLDDGTGQLRDGSINCQINSADILSKRKGFVRGLDEYFGSVVCGLFAYTDHCGREWLLVADEDAINIRQPFVLPQFTASDAYPNDAFVGTGAVNTEKWRNTSRYELLDGVLVQAAGAAPFTGMRLGSDLFQRWFKDAGSFSYEVEANYRFDASLADEQRVGLVIRGNGDLSDGALLQADVVFASGTYSVNLWHREADGTYRVLEAAPVTGSTTDPRGVLTLKLERNLATGKFTPSVSITPNLGTPQTFNGAALNVIQDADLGLVSAVAVGQKGGVLSTSIGIDIVQGRPV